MSTAFETILLVCLTLLSLGILLILYRFIKGPSLADRISAIDLISTSVICIIGVFSIFTERTFIDVALLLALITFLGSISFAYFIIQRVDRRNE